MWETIKRGSGVTRRSCSNCFCWNTGEWVEHLLALLTVSRATIRLTFSSVSSGMSLLQAVVLLALSWTGLCQLLSLVATVLVAAVALWTVKLLVRHAWYTQRLSCFSKPHADSWLLGHLGKVGPTSRHLSADLSVVQQLLTEQKCIWECVSDAQDVVGVAAVTKHPLWDTFPYNPCIRCSLNEPTFKRGRRWKPSWTHEGLWHWSQIFPQNSHYLKISNRKIKLCQKMCPVTQHASPVALILFLVMHLCPSDAKHRRRAPGGGRVGADVHALLQLVHWPVLSPGQSLPPWLHQTSADGTR